MGIKIEGTGSRGSNPMAGRISGDVPPVREQAGLSFGTQLGRSFGNNQDELLEQMAKDVIAQGEKLKGRIDIGELKQYKRLVSGFLEEAVRDFGKFSKDSFLDRRGRHRVFATVKNINQKMEELTRDVMTGQQDNLTIVSKIEDIRGMVLDLFL